MGTKAVPVQPSSACASSIVHFCVSDLLQRSGRVCKREIMDVVAAFFFTGWCPSLTASEHRINNIFDSFYLFVRGMGYCFWAISFFLCLFVSLSGTLWENGWTDLHEIFREGVEWPWNDLIQFWVSSPLRVNGSVGWRSSCLLSPAIAQKVIVIR